MATSSSTMSPAPSHVFFHSKTVTNDIFHNEMRPSSSSFLSSGEHKTTNFSLKSYQRLFKFKMDSSCNHLFSFFLLLLFSYHNLIGMVRSDEYSLINTLCSKTEEPVICRECLQADPNSKSANGQGLALIAIACAERDTSFLHEDTFKLLQNATGQLKGILDDCTQHSSSAKQEFQPSVMYCLNLFDQNPELPVPQQVLAGTVASNQTCRNAVEILSSI